MKTKNTTSEVREGLSVSSQEDGELPRFRAFVLRVFENLRDFVLQTPP